MHDCKMPEVWLDSDDQMLIHDEHYIGWHRKTALPA
jgi:hypothetical protein